jgi:hypothetical protein
VDELYDLVWIMRDIPCQHENRILVSNIWLKEHINQLLDLGTISSVDMQV